MAVVIAASVGSSMGTATGTTGSGKLQYAPNQGAWWMFYLTSTQSLSAKYSTDFTTWTAPTGSPFTLHAAHHSFPIAFGFTVKSIGGVDAQHMLAKYQNDSSYESRFTLGTTWTNTNAETAVTANTSFDQSGTSIVLDSGNLSTNNWVGSGFQVRTTFGTTADTGSSWSTGWASELAWNVINGVASVNVAIIPCASRYTLLFSDNASTTGNMTNVEWRDLSAGSPSHTIATVFTAFTSTSSANFGVGRLSDSDLHACALTDNASTITHRRYSGSAWSNGQTVPSLTLATNSGISVVSDGTSVWMFAIDSSKNIQYVKWTSGGGWGSWTVLEATRTNTPAYVTANYSSGANAIGVVWTEANGANFDVVGSSLSLASAPTKHFLSLMGCGS